MADPGNPKSIPHLTCREIQAPLVSALIEGFAREVGEERALGVALEVIGRDAAESGRSLAKAYGGNSLGTLLEVIQEVWAGDGTMELSNVQLTGEALEFHVTSCRYADLYKRLGIEKLGCVMSCSRDFPFMDGFNPEIELVRSQTIMEGAATCDFRYRKK